MKLFLQHFAVEEDALQNGYFIRYTGEKTSDVELSLAEFEAGGQILCSYRNNPWFNHGKIPENFSGVTYETQWLCHKDQNGVYTVLYALVDEPLRASFFGKEENVLSIFIESGDIATKSTGKTVAFCIQGTDFYQLIEKAPESIANRLKTCTTRKEKRLPEFYPYFGWCTWDSFYEKVKHSDIEKGLESFSKGGFVPRFLLLDDGWQTVCEEYENRGLHKLSSLCANEKFNGDLTETVRLAKEDYGVKQFYVWHALLGYWGGIEPNAPQMQKYGAKNFQKRYSPQLRSVVASPLEEILGVPDSDKVFAFYNDYHKLLSACGVDGVKVDVQFNTEAIGRNNGGRVKNARIYREALEASVNLHFGGGLINCMCGSNDLTYHYKASAVARSSDDYYPDDPRSHGAHIFKNAVNSMWIGGFIYCDWDMFQTLHPCGDFHAAARAVSGSPVYVSDRVDEHDFEIIRKLTTSDGKLLMATDLAKPTEDSLFVSPEDFDLYKIFNYNTFGGVIGVFNLTDSKEPITKAFSPSDIPEFQDGRYVLYYHKKDCFEIKEANEKSELSLTGITAEIVTVMPITDGFCAIGLCDKYNSAAAVKTMVHYENTYLIGLSGGGKFAFYSEKTPIKVTCRNDALSFIQKGNHIYEVTVCEESELLLAITTD